MTAVLRLTLVSSVKIDGRADMDPQQPTINLTNRYEEHLTYGTGANQANTVWWETRTIAAGANDDLDLTALTKSTPGGTASVSFTCIKSIQIENLDTTAGDYLKVGKVASVANGWEGPFGTTAGSYQNVEPEGCYANHQKSAAGWTVDSTHKVLRINNPGANPINCRVTLVGEA